MLNSVPAEEEESGSEADAETDPYYTRDELLAATPNIPLLETLEKAGGISCFGSVSDPTGGSGKAERAVCGREPAAYAGLPSTISTITTTAQP